jgi:hypothetical protein
VPGQVFDLGTKSRSDGSPHRAARSGAVCILAVRSGSVISGAMKQPITVRLTERNYERLQRLAARSERSMSYIIEKAVDEYLDKPRGDQLELLPEE